MLKQMVIMLKNCLFTGIFRGFAPIFLLETAAQITGRREACHRGNLRQRMVAFAYQSSCMTQSYASHEKAWRLIHNGREFLIQSGSLHALAAHPHSGHIVPSNPLCGPSVFLPSSVASSACAGCKSRGPRHPPQCRW